MLNRKIVDVNTKLLGKDHPLTATSLNNLGGVLLAKGDLDGSELYLRQSLEIRRRVVESNHPHLAITLNNLGKALSRKNLCAQAEPLFREALTILSQTDFDPSRKANVKNNLGNCFLITKNYFRCSTGS